MSYVPLYTKDSPLYNGEPFSHNLYGYLKDDTY